MSLSCSAALQTTHRLNQQKYCVLYPASPFDLGLFYMISAHTGSTVTTFQHCWTGGNESKLAGKKACSVAFTEYFYMITQYQMWACSPTAKRAVQLNNNTFQFLKTKNKWKALKWLTAKSFELYLLNSRPRRERGSRLVGCYKKFSIGATFALLPVESELAYQKKKNAFLLVPFYWNTVLFKQ